MSVYAGWNTRLRSSMLRAAPRRRRRRVGDPVCGMKRARTVILGVAAFQQQRLIAPHLGT